jgi:hypothetical protein
MFNTLILEKRFSTKVIINLESSLKTNENENEKSDEKLKSGENFINEIESEKPNSDNKNLIVSNDDKNVENTMNQGEPSLDKLNDVRETETITKSIHHIKLAERNTSSKTYTYI